MDAEWWDIVNAIAQSIGALGTMGALLVAALVYRRQVADARSAQARRVRAAYGPSHLELHNDSGAPIYEAYPAQLHPRRAAPASGAGDWFQDVELFVGRHFVVRHERPISPRYLIGRRGRIDPGGVLDVYLDHQSAHLGRYGWTFRDDNGRLWFRQVGSGALVPVRTRVRETAPGAWRFRLLDRLLALNARVRNRGGGGAAGSR